MALLSLRDIRVAFGGPPLLEGASLQIEPGDRICLLGRNGTGKSTLLKVVDGEIAPDEGEIVRQQGVTVALVPQEIPPGLSGTVYEVVSGGPADGGGEGDLPPWTFSGRRFRDPFGGDAAPGADRPGACPERRTSSFSTSPPTTWTSTASPGSRPFCSGRRGRFSSSRTTGCSCGNWRRGSWSSTAGDSATGRAITTRTSSAGRRTLRPKPRSGRGSTRGSRRRRRGSAGA